MDKHPIETIMSTTMENIRDMIDVNTVVGDAVTPAEGTVIIPISRVSFGFVAGGGEYGDTRGDVWKGSHICCQMCIHLHDFIVHYGSLPDTPFLSRESDDGFMVLIN